MINKLIKLIKEIDKALDAYEFRGYTYEEYKELISQGKRGDRSLRYSIVPGTGGKHIWTNIMQDTLDRSKKITNLLYLEHKNKYNLTTDDYHEIYLLIKRIKEMHAEFKKNTDNFSIYPIQAETIGDNLNEMTKILSIYNDCKRNNY